MTSRENSQNPKPIQTLLGTSGNRRETKKCITCGKDFETIVRTIQGRDVQLMVQCSECKKADITKMNSEEQERRKVQEFNFIAQRKRELKSKIPLRFQEVTFKDFDFKKQPRAFKIMDEYDINFGSVILASPNVWGVGKTHLVCATLNRIIDGIKPDEYMRIATPFYFTTENNLLLRIRNTYKKSDDESEDEDSIYRDLKKYQFLVIDDVGKVIPADLSFLQRVYFQIINDRYNDQLDIIITTNLDLKQLSQYIGIACADRLYEMCGKDNIVIMKGESYRQREVK
jgi:DNA replication protein DnaC